MRSKLSQILKADNAAVLFGNLLASAFGLITFMLLARFLDKSEFGSWAVFISASGLVELMKTGLIRQALVRELSTGQDNQAHQTAISSAWVLTIVVSGVLAVLIALANLLIHNESLTLFLTYYPLLSLSVIASNFTTWQAHAQGDFWKMNQIRIFNNLLFLAFVLLGYLKIFELTLIVAGYIGVNLIVSIFCYFKYLYGIQLRNYSSKKAKQLLAFGKHSLATLAGANLLKSADSLIIGWLMGTEAVAIYAIPLKVLDLLEIPLRGFVMTSFRKLTRFFSEQNIKAFKMEFFRNTSILTGLFVLGAIVIFFIPQFIIEILGGSGYEKSVFLLQIFMIPMMLLPMDKFLGISLDAANLPQLNAIKVWIMVILNVVGDFVVINLYGELWPVALVTILNIVAGIVFGIVVNPVFGIAKKSKVIIVEKSN